MSRSKDERRKHRKTKQAQRRLVRQDERSQELSLVRERENLRLARQYAASRGLRVVSYEFHGTLATLVWYGKGSPSRTLTP